MDAPQRSRASFLPVALFFRLVRAQGQQRCDATTLYRHSLRAFSFRKASLIVFYRELRSIIGFNGGFSPNKVAVEIEGDLAVVTEEEEAGVIV